MDIQGNPPNQGKAWAGWAGSEGQWVVIRMAIFVQLRFFFAVCFSFRLIRHELLLELPRVPHSVPNGVAPRQTAAFSQRVQLTDRLAHLRLVLGAETCSAAPLWLCIHLKQR